MERPDRGGEPDPSSASPVRWQIFRIRRHVGWARTQGLRRLIEEDQLDPFERIPAAIGRARWRRSHDFRPNAVPLFLVGAQRSGTNMLSRAFLHAPEVEVHNENDRAAFERFRLRPEPVIRGIVRRSRHAFVLFKPLCDSHRTTVLLDDLHAPSRGRAIWAYRGFEGRVRSSIAKFGDSNLQALRRIARGDGAGLWQAGGLGEERLDLIRSFDLRTMSPASASALFWFLRNSLYFDLGLDRRGDVTLTSYEAMVTDPETTMRSLCHFVGLPFRPALIARIEARRPAVHEVDIDPAIRSLCSVLQRALDDSMRDRASHPAG